jgi:hypothetical protein
LNPSNTGVGGNTSLPPPWQPDSRNAPVPAVLIPLGNVTQRDSDGNIVSSPILPAAGNGTGNGEKGETPLTSVDGVNAANAISTTAVGNDAVNSESVAELADNFQKILRSEQEGLSPELKNQSPQEKCLRALSTLDNHSLMRAKDREMAKAIHQSSKTSESWLQTYLQSVAPESTLTPAKLVQDLKEFSECQDTRKYLDENMQLVTSGDKVVVVTSPDFLKEHYVMPLGMMRKCAKDLIEKRTLMDYGTRLSTISKTRTGTTCWQTTSPWLAPVRKKEESTTVDLASVVAFEQKINSRKMVVSQKTLTPMCQRKMPPLLL